MATRWTFLRGALKAADIIGLLLSIGVAALIPYYLAGLRITFLEFLQIRIAVLNLVFLAGLTAIWSASFHYVGLYPPTRLTPLTSEPIAIGKATGLGASCLAIAGLVFGIDIVTPGFIAAFWIIGTTWSTGVRIATRYLLHLVGRRGRNLRELLVVGTNERAFAFARRIRAEPDLGYHVAGFVDMPREVPAEFTALDLRIVTDFGGFADYLASHVVDEVVVCLPVKSQYARAAGIIDLCREQGVLVRFLSEIFDAPHGDPVQVDHIGGYAVVTLATGPDPGLATMLKRLLDIAVSLAMLILLAPVAGAVIVAIALTSPGPVHFVQERLGLHKRRFRMYKFRTMVPGAEAQREALEALNEVEGPVFKITADPRVTAVGRFLRKTSLDELPQLLNVFKGDMSLVGPRPLPIRDYEGFDEDWHRRRFSVRPGLTCLWQVQGRSTLSFDRWMELDMEYIDRWSLGLDFRILMQTIPAVIRGSGAS